MKEGGENSLPAPLRARGCKRQFAVKLPPTVIDRPTDEPVILRNADGGVRAELLDAHLLGKERNNKFRYFLFLSKYKTQTRPAGFITMLEDRQLTPWLVSETRNRIEAE